jgi:hypothetical protein
MGKEQSAICGREPGMLEIDDQGNLKFKDTLRNLYLNEIEASY